MSVLKLHPHAADVGMGSAIPGVEKIRKPARKTALEFRYVSKIIGGNEGGLTCLKSARFSLC